MPKFKNILLVEDDAITKLVCERIIKIYDFSENIVFKENGKEAIDYIQELLTAQQPLPEIIFLDINMPVMNGWEFLKEYEKLLTQCSHTPQIFILSSTANPEDFVSANSFKTVNSVLAKPLTKEHLDNIGGRSEINNK
ncbi:MAG: response regulator [Chitinophagaceae bacterium]